MAKKYGNKFKNYNTKSGYDSRLEERVRLQIDKFLNDYFSNNNDYQLIEQYKIELFPSYTYSTCDIKSINYVCDFVIMVNDRVLLIEAKGLELEVYNIKKKMLLHSIKDDKNVNFIEVKSDNIKYMYNTLKHWLETNEVDPKETFSILRVGTTKVGKAEKELEEFKLPNDLLSIYNKITNRTTYVVRLHKFMINLGKKQRYFEWFKLEQKLSKEFSKKRNKWLLTDNQMNQLEKNWLSIIELLEKYDLFVD